MFGVCFDRWRSIAAGCVLAASFAASGAAPLLGAGDAAAPLHREIDRLISERAGAEPRSPPADDAELLRRLFLDLAGRIPTRAEASEFLAETAPDRRERWIDRLLFSPAHAVRRAELFDSLLMERRGEHAGWFAYLVRSAAANASWDRIAREILLPDPTNAATRDSAYFYARRLEHYGENPIDYPGLVRDVGRLFLGVDLRCAQCHDHLFVDDYKQLDFQGLFSAYRQLAIADGSEFPAVVERPATGPLEFASVFDKLPRRTGPRIPGGPELELAPPPADGSPPPRSALEKFAVEITSAANPTFARSIVNRLWHSMLGRGLVEPLDLHHGDNPASHPELLDRLADHFVASGCDVRDLLRELALSETYQRSSVLPEGGTPPADLFLCALERRLSAEQLHRSVLAATGDGVAAAPATEADRGDPLRRRFVKALAGRPGEPELEARATLESALFWRNDAALLSLLERRPGNLVDRLAAIDDAAGLASELYWSVLTRPPSAEEVEEVARHLARPPDERDEALALLVWALLSSAEFAVNH